MNFFATENFRIYRTESFPHENFQSCETKQFRRKIVIPAHPLLSVTFFHTRKLRNINWSPYEIFRHCEKKSFDGKSCYSAPSLTHTFFRYRKFSETPRRKVPRRSFSLLPDKTISKQNRDSRPLSLIRNTFRYPKLKKHFLIRLRNVLASWEKPISTEIRDSRPSSVVCNFFHTRK